LSSRKHRKLNHLFRLVAGKSLHRDRVAIVTGVADVVDVVAARKLPVRHRLCPLPEAQPAKLPRQIRLPN
jgi:hypothetical protein